MNKLLLLLAVLVPLLSSASDQSTPLLITNVRIFDGTSSKLSKPSNVLIVGNKIAQVSTAAVKVEPGARLIEGGGRVLMPGMIDTHVHLSIVDAIPKVQSWDWGYLSHRMAEASEAMLLRGFTTVRDLGGPVFGLKRAIDEGITPGPRIFPSGAFLTQTSGHGDFRGPADPHPDLTGQTSSWQRLGYFRLSDGDPEILQAVRENLGRGATQIKAMASGGVGSLLDPIDSLQYTEAEMRTVVQAAADWGTYVAVHAHNAESIKRALRAGVLSIDHGFMMDEAGARLLARKKAFLSMQFAMLDYAPLMPGLTPGQIAKVHEVTDASKNAVTYIKRHKLKLTFSTDAFGPSEATTYLQTQEFSARARSFTPLEILRQATSGSAELVELCGKRNPYDGKLGVIQPGALADVLIVDGNPLEDIEILGRPGESLVLIVKDGRIEKNLL